MTKTMTLAQRYNSKAEQIMPHMADSLRVDPAIDCAGEIDDIVFRRSEYLGGKAGVLLALIHDAD